MPVIGAAPSCNPADPVPWRIALTHARGMQAPREVFDDYLAEAEARDPHHFGCHAQALQYLCAKWYGSHEEKFRYAERVAASAPPGSGLHALPLQAALEYRLSRPTSPRAPTRTGPRSTRPSPAPPRPSPTPTTGRATARPPDSATNWPCC